MAKDFERVFGSPERVRWIQSLPCCACHRIRGSECHHVRNGGMGRRADAHLIVPLCFWCHRRYHQIGKLAMLQAVMRDKGGLLVGAERYDQWDDAAAAIERKWRPLGG